MQSSPATTAALYTVAGLAAGKAIGHPKFGGAVGLGLGLRAPPPGERLFDARGDARALSRAALAPSVDGYGKPKVGSGQVTTGKVLLILGATVAPFTLYPYLLKLALPDSGYWPRVAVSVGGVLVANAILKPGKTNKAGFGALPGQFTSTDWKSFFGRNRSTRLRQGDLKGSPYAKAPRVARNLEQAKLAAAYGFKYGKGSAASLAQLVKSGPWASATSINGAIDAALKSGIDRDARAYLIGVRLRSKGTFTPGVSTAGKYRSPKPAPPRGVGPLPRPAPIYETPTVEAQAFAPEGGASRPWYQQRGVLIGAGVLGGGLVLALLLGGRRK